MALSVVTFTQCDLIKEEINTAVEVESVVIDSVQPDTSDVIVTEEVEFDDTYKEFTTTYSDSMTVYKVIIGSFKTYDYAVKFAESNNAQLMDIDDKGFYKVSLADYKYRYDAALTITELDSPAWLLVHVEY